MSSSNTIDLPTKASFQFTILLTVASNLTRGYISYLGYKSRKRVFNNLLNLLIPSSAKDLIKPNAEVCHFTQFWKSRQRNLAIVRLMALLQTHFLKIPVQFSCLMFLSEKQPYRSHSDGEASLSTISALRMWKRIVNFLFEKTYWGRSRKREAAMKIVMNKRRGLFWGRHQPKHQTCSNDLLVPSPLLPLVSELFAYIHLPSVWCSVMRYFFK